tara:strand:+ start:581 stop:1333 length:753 start_codon:yes stop_codon:yes gene_type:complete
MKITNIYRYPIKSFTEEEKNVVQISDFSRIIGDRIAAFRIGNDHLNHDWLPKKNYLSLMHVPHISRIKIKYIDSINKLSLKIPDKDEIQISASNIKKMETLISDFLNKNKFEKKFNFISTNHGNISFHDTKDGLISLHSLASEKKIKNSFEAIERVRFRSNFIIDSCEPFEELSWVGKTISISELKFKVIKIIRRCAAVNCNPTSGIYDKNLLRILPNLNGIEEPSFGIKLMLISNGGTIKIGDKVSLIS